MAEAQYRIGAVARLTGLTTHVIRIWERRYRVLAPARSQGGARLYSQLDVERLRLLGRAVSRGHAIGQVASLENDALERLAGPGTSDDAPGLPAESSAGFAEELKRAVRDYDLVRAERVLSRASAQYSPRTMVLDLLGPALKHIGDAWATGEICVGSEHMASALVRDRIGMLLRSYSADPDAESVVLTTPSGELHELGAQLAAAVAAMHGFRAVYLGPNLPVSEIADAVRRSGSKIAALSVVALDPRSAAHEVSRLTELVPNDVAILVGGARSAEVAAFVGEGVEVHSTLAAFERWLVERSAARQDRPGA